VQADSPRASVAPFALTELYPTAPTAGNNAADAAPVPFRELHPLARVRALRTMAARSGVDRYGFEVLTALALRMDEAGTAQVGQVRLATEARCSERTVRNRLGRLERAGLLIRRRSGPRGLTRYQLACPTVDALDTPTADRHRPAPPAERHNETERGKAHGQTGTAPPSRLTRPARWGAAEGSDRRKTSASAPAAQTGTARADRHRSAPPAIRVRPPLAAREARVPAAPDRLGALATLRTWRAAHQPALPGFATEPASATAEPACDRGGG
jgi:hypothetical protein